MSKITAQTAAAEIVDQMSHDDVCGFTVAAWRDGISAMLQGEWEGLDLDEVLDATQVLVTDARWAELLAEAEALGLHHDENSIALLPSVDLRQDGKDIWLDDGGVAVLFGGELPRNTTILEIVESTLEETANAVRRQLSANTRYTIEARPESRDLLVTVELAADENYDDHAEDGVLIEAGLRLVDSGEEDGYLWAVWTL